MFGRVGIIPIKPNVCTHLRFDVTNKYLENPNKITGLILDIKG